MQEESQNKNNSWRRKLHGLEALTSEPVFQLTEAWDKLHNRLERKKRNHKPILWLIAAACTVSIVLLLAIYHPRKDTTNNVAKNENDSQSAVIGNQEKLKLLLNRPAPIVVNPKPSLPKKASTRIKLKQSNVIKDTVVQIHTPPLELLIESPTLAKADTASTIPRKRLRVVHINELEPTGEEQMQEWTRSEKAKSTHSNRNNLIRSYVSNSTSDKVLKITISPAN